MNTRIEKCASCWYDGKCRLSSEVLGWGCRLLTILPEYLPTTEHEKGRLFSKVYGMAQQLGVLKCPHYDELTIDRTLADDSMLSDMVLMNQPLRADLLSEIFEYKHNCL